MAESNIVQYPAMVSPPTILNLEQYFKNDEDVPLPLEIILQEYLAKSGLGEKLEQ